MAMHPDFWAKEARDARWSASWERRLFHGDPKRIAYWDAQAERAEGACAATTLGEVLGYLGWCLAPAAKDGAQ